MLKVKLNKINASRLFSTTLILFLIGVIAIPFSDTLYDSTKVLGRNIVYALVPLGFLWLPKWVISNYKNGLLKGLVFGSLVTSVLLLSVNFIKYFSQNDGYSILSYYYTYHEFTAFINKHPTFLGFEILFGLVILLGILNRSREIKKSILMIVGAVILCAALIFINSRAIIFLLILTLLGFGLQKTLYLIQTKRFKVLFLLIFSGIALALGIFKYTQNTYFFERYTKELKWDLTYQSGTSIFSKDQGDSRFARWHSALKVIEQKPLIGHGNNSEVRELLKQYEKDELHHALQNQYHSHNVYLSYLIEYGVWGFLLLLIFLVSNIYLAIKNRDNQWLIFSFFVIFVSIFDIYLVRSGGILMTALWMNTFLFSHLKNTSEEIHSSI